MLSGMGETAVLKGSPMGSLSVHNLSACVQHFFPVFWRRQLFRCDEDQHSQVDAEGPRQCPVQKAEPRCSHADPSYTARCMSQRPWTSAPYFSSLGFVICNMGHQWSSHGVTGGWGGEMYVRCIELCYPKCQSLGTCDYGTLGMLPVQSRCVAGDSTSSRCQLKRSVK